MTHQPEMSIDPEVFCPACRQTFIEGDAWELGLGSVVECRYCEAQLELIDETFTRDWGWRLIKEKEDCA